MTQQKVELKFSITEKQYERLKELLKTDNDLWQTIQLQSPCEKLKNTCFDCKGEISESGECFCNRETEHAEDNCWLGDGTQNIEK